MTTFEEEFWVDDVCYKVEFEADEVIPEKTSGPPENCYPEEGGEVTVLDILVEGVSVLSELNESVFQQLEILAREKTPELFDGIAHSLEEDIAEAIFESRRLRDD